MKIAIVSGGSGGHIFPALEVAKALRKDNEIIFIGSNKKMEAKIVSKEGITFKGFDIDNKIFKLLKNIKYFRKYLREEKFDLVIGFGNYISVSFLLAAKKEKIKYLIHEQNLYPGKANRLLHLFSFKTLISYKESKKYLRGKKTIYVGNPREELASKYPYSPSKETQILLVMGSLGSSSINKIVSEMLENYPLSAKITIVSGEKYQDFFNKNYPLNKVKVVPFNDSLKNLATYDLIISRAGATSLKEFGAMGMPLILIPSPYVSNNHQYKNALYYQEKKAALILEEENLTAFKLKETIEKLLSNRNELLSLHLNILKDANKMALNDFIKEVKSC